MNGTHTSAGLVSRRRLRLRLAMLMLVIAVLQLSGMTAIALGISGRPTEADSLRSSSDDGEWPTLTDYRVGIKIAYPPGWSIDIANDTTTPEHHAVSFSPPPQERLRYGAVSLDTFERDRGPCSCIGSGRDSAEARSKGQFIRLVKIAGRQYCRVSSMDHAMGSSWYSLTYAIIEDSVCYVLSSRSNAPFGGPETGPDPPHFARMLSSFESPRRSERQPRITSEPKPQVKSK
jgi:hypothetical protein